MRNLMFLAFAGGVSLAMQGTLNARLGVELKNPLLASAIAFMVSAVTAILVVLTLFRTYPTRQQLADIPFYLWVAGGIFSAIGIGLYYYTMPKLGVSKMISIGLCGQLIFGLVAGHFGWFGFPLDPLNLRRVLGALSMLAGIFLMNFK